MSEKVLFVDYENVKAVDFEAVPSDVAVRFFFGAAQANVSTGFHIAYYLGEHPAKTPSAECFILSKDQGFDPLVKHLKGLVAHGDVSFLDCLSPLALLLARS